MQTEYSSRDAARFWSKVDQSGDCWEWRGTIFSTGYGAFWHAPRRNNVGAHRVAWELTFGPIPDGLWVLHHCDNPPCCNPTHLFLGTTQDNTADSTRKGRKPRGDQHHARLHPERMPRGDQHPARLHPERMARGDRSGRRLHPERYTRQKPPPVRRGEANNHAKLTAEQVRDIRRRYVPGSVSLKHLGDDYGVSLQTIWMIVKGRLWKHVT